MPRVRVTVTIPASTARVWAALEDIATHVDWMAEATALTFTSPDGRRKGVGTTFDCETRVGPITMVDRMEVTEWRPRRVMGVRHSGIVTGTGRFVLRRRGRQRTKLVWDEHLHFPWWAGGPVGATAGALVLRRIWRGNLRRFRDLVAPG